MTSPRAWGGTGGSILLLLLLLGCRPTESTLPKAHHASGRILVVANAALWEGTPGESLRDVFLQAIPGLPQPEPYFTLTHVPPADFSSTLQRWDKILALSQQRNGRTTPQHRWVKNKFARGQSLLFLSAKEIPALNRYIQAHATSFREHFEQKDKAHLAKKLFAVRNKPAESSIREKYALSLQIPHGYEIAKEVKEKDGGFFLWLRHYSPTLDKNLWIVATPQETPILPSHAFDHRARLASRYMRDSEKEGLYLSEQTVVPAVTKQTSFRGHPAVERRGLWQLSDRSSGGPFVSYTFTRPALKKLYYAEGFVYCPAKDKRYFMREVELILLTMHHASVSPYE